MLNTEEEKVIEGSVDGIHEVSFHLVSSLSPDEVKKATGVLKSGIEESGGEIISSEAPARMKLAYPMERKVSNKKETYQEAYFGWFKFIGFGEAATTVDELFKTHENMLRYLMINTVKEDTFYHLDETEDMEEEVLQSEAMPGADGSEKTSETKDADDKETEKTSETGDADDKGSEDREKVNDEELDEALEKSVGETK